MAPKRVALSLRIHPDLHQRLHYWAEKNDLSVNEYIISAIETAIDHENKNYDLPTAEIQRINQIADTVAGLDHRMETGFKTIFQMMDIFINLTRGDNYLAGEDDGELPYGNKKEAL